MKERLFTNEDLGCAWYPKPIPRQTLAVAKNQSIWMWSCGWQCVERLRGAKGYTPKHGAHSLGHKQFRSAVQLLIATAPEKREVLLGVEKPGQPWRRFIAGALYDHFLYGSVKIKATDGMRAIVEDVDGMLLQVMFDNLVELKPRAEIKLKCESKAKPAGESKEKKQKVQADLLAKLMGI